jgi:hippurate hydrolase
MEPPMNKVSSSDPALRNLEALLPDLAELYKDVHSHPELSMQETRTAKLAADRLAAAGYDVTTSVGKTGATDREGKTVPVSHMCGHDMHVTWLAGATKLLADARTSWRGTLMVVFQPAEETGEGAQAMIDDGLFKRFPKPDVILGQHVMVGPSGTVAGRPGAITSAADSLQIRFSNGP